jgi:hypothetical protein
MVGALVGAWYVNASLPPLPEGIAIKVERERKQEADEAVAAVRKKHCLERKGRRRRHAWLMLGEGEYLPIH